jgi:hypothetical protein
MFRRATKKSVGFVLYFSGWNETCSIMYYSFCGHFIPSCINFLAQLFATISIENIKPSRPLHSLAPGLGE